MKIKKIILSFSLIVIIILGVLFFVIPYYKRKRLSNIDTAKSTIKIAPNLDVIYFAQHLPIEVWKMTNSEVNLVYKYMYHYILNNIQPPKEMVDKIVLVFSKYDLFP